MRVLASAAIPTRSITRRQRRLCSSGEIPEYSAALDQIQSSAFTTSPHGVPMMEQKHPGREQKAPPRTHGIEAALQTGKVPLHHISARRQQSDSKKEKAVRRKRRRNRDMKVRVWAGRCFFKPTSRRPKNGVCATLGLARLAFQRGVTKLLDLLPPFSVHRLSRPSSPPATTASLASSRGRPSSGKPNSALQKDGSTI